MAWAFRDRSLALEGARLGLGFLGPGLVRPGLESPAQTSLNLPIHWMQEGLFFSKKSWKYYDGT
jgi:hypothetical protein